MNGWMVAALVINKTFKLNFQVQEAISDLYTPLRLDSRVPQT